MTNKERNERQKAYQLAKRKELSEKAARQQANLKALQDANRANARVIPNGHPLSPQIEDKTVLPNRKPLYGTPDYIPQRKINQG